MDGEVALGLAAVMPAHPVAVAVMVVVTDVGSPVSVNLLTGAAVVVLLLRRRVRVAAYLIAVRLCVLVVETALKHGLGRPRPPVHPLTSASGFSFPSGHAGGTAALCVSVLFVLLPVVHHRWRVVAVAAAVLLSVAVAVSRVVLGVHYPSDVVGGLLVGVLCGVVLMPVVERRRRGISSVRAGPPDGGHGTACRAPRCMRTNPQSSRPVQVPAAKESPMSPVHGGDVQPCRRPGRLVAPALCAALLWRRPRWRAHRTCSPPCG